jgi:hypothetical protein
LSVEKSKTDSVVITHDCAGSAILEYSVLNAEVCSAEWGDFTSAMDVELFITGRSPGKTTVTITFAGGTGNPSARLEIYVTVR